MKKKEKRKNIKEDRQLSFADSYLLTSIFTPWFVHMQGKIKLKNFKNSCIFKTILNNSFTESIQCIYADFVWKEFPFSLQIRHTKHPSSEFLCLFQCCLEGTCGNNLNIKNVKSLYNILYVMDQFKYKNIKSLYNILPVFALKVKYFNIHLVFHQV